MGRGRALKSKIKETKALTKAGLQATKEWEERSNNIGYGIKKHLAKLIDRIDVLELTAVGGLAFIIYGVLSTSEEVLGTIIGLMKKHASEKFPWGGTFTQIMQWIFRRPELFPWLDVKPEELLPDHVMMILSFVLAVIIVRHPEVITEMFAGATKMTTFALGLLKT